MNDAQMLAMLRHAYHQLCEGVVSDGKRFADGLLSPVICSLEQRNLGQKAEGEKLPPGCSLVSDYVAEQRKDPVRAAAMDRARIRMGLTAKGKAT